MMFPCFLTLYNGSQVSIVALWATCFIGQNIFFPDLSYTVLSHLSIFLKKLKVGRHTYIFLGGYKHTRVGIKNSASVGLVATELFYALKCLPPNI